MNSTLLHNSKIKLPSIWPKGTGESNFRNFTGKNRYSPTLSFLFDNQLILRGTWNYDVCFWWFKTDNGQRGSNMSHYSSSVQSTKTQGWRHIISNEKATEQDTARLSKTRSWLSIIAPHLRFEHSYFWRRKGKVDIENFIISMWKISLKIHKWDKWHCASTGQFWCKYPIMFAWPKPWLLSILMLKLRVTSDVYQNSIKVRKILFHMMIR